MNYFERIRDRGSRSCNSWHRCDLLCFCGFCNPMGAGGLEGAGITGFDMEGFQKALNDEGKRRLELVEQIVFEDDDLISDAQKVPTMFKTKINVSIPSLYGKRVRCQPVFDYSWNPPVTAAPCFFSRHVRRVLTHNQRWYDLLLFWMDTLGLGVFSVIGVELEAANASVPTMFKTKINVSIPSLYGNRVRCQPVFDYSWNPPATAAPCQPPLTRGPLERKPAGAHLPSPPC
mgnify:CR=1 FL=1